MKQQQNTQQEREAQWCSREGQPGLVGNRRACEELQDTLPVVAQALRQPVEELDALRWRYLDDKVRTGLRQGVLTQVQQSQTQRDLLRWSDQLQPWWRRPRIILLLLAGLAIAGSLAYLLESLWTAPEPAVAQAFPVLGWFLGA